ncbi:MAG: hypothetical protein JW966_06325 [Anaerolineae bacterium]|nr:hypothetical protein [Anaerolineae bacterium]
MQIVRSFKSLYLSEMNYFEDTGITVAIVRPTDCRGTNLDLPQQICVDANGNVSVLHQDFIDPALNHLVFRRLVLAVGGLLIIVGIPLSLLM